MVTTSKGIHIEIKLSSKAKKSQNEKIDGEGLIPTVLLDCERKESKQVQRLRVLAVSLTNKNSINDFTRQIRSISTRSYT